MKHVFWAWRGWIRGFEVLVPGEMCFEDVWTSEKGVSGVRTGCNVI